MCFLPDGESLMQHPLALYFPASFFSALRHVCEWPIVKAALFEYRVNRVKVLASAIHSTSKLAINDTVLATMLLLAFTPVKKRIKTPKVDRKGRNKRSTKTCTISLRRY